MAGGECELFYWRENNYEVDFVLRLGKKVVLPVTPDTGQLISM